MVGLNIPVEVNFLSEDWSLYLAQAFGGGSGSVETRLNIGFTVAFPVGVNENGFSGDRMTAIVYSY